MNTIRIFLVIVFTAVISQGYAQKVKQVSVKFKDEKIKEKYHVLKDDMLTKHGEYRRYYKKELTEKGYYKNGVREGAWSYYRYGALIGHGTYTHGEKSGEWKYFDRKGQVVQKYDHTNKLVLYDATFAKDNPGQQSPVYIGGSEMMNAVLMENLRIPDELPRYTVTTVHVAFVVGTDGSFESVNVVDPVKHPVSLVKEAERLVWLLNGGFVAGRYNDANVRVRLTIPLKITVK